MGSTEGVGLQDHSSKSAQLLSWFSLFMKVEILEILSIN